MLRERATNVNVVLLRASCRLEVQPGRNAGRTQKPDTEGAPTWERK